MFTRKFKHYSCMLCTLKIIMISKKIRMTVVITGMISIFIGICSILKSVIVDSLCIIESDGVFSKFVQKPLNCEICENLSSIDVVHDIDQKEFEEKYSYTGRPLIIRGAAKNWTALKVFDYEFFKTLNNVTHMSECQFINYNNEFGNLNAALNIDSKRINMANKTNWWYFGWSVCDPLAVKILRQYYTKPHFLSLTSENYIVDWIFMGTSGHGAVLHVDNVNFPSWQAQIKGTKRWKLQSPVECLYLCQNTYYIDVFPGDIIVLDTNLWYHATEVISKEISITIGAEYD